MPPAYHGSPQTTGLGRRLWLLVGSVFGCCRPGVQSFMGRVMGVPPAAREDRP